MPRQVDLESKFQAKLIKKIEHQFPGAVVLKNDSGYRQGIPDLSIFHRSRWSILEVKPKYARPGTDDFEPNQEWYLDKFNEMWFASVIYPENEEEVFASLHRALSSSE
jgi:hypothetical protein